MPRPTDSKAASTRLTINSSILEDAIAPRASSSTTPFFSPEDVFEVWCEPQAVFRVRSVGRCSATMSGEFAIHLYQKSAGAYGQATPRPYFAVRIRHRESMLLLDLGMLLAAFGIWRVKLLK